MGISKVLTSLWKSVNQFFKNSNIKKGLSILLFFTITILILFSNFNPKQVMLKPDEVAQRDIQSNVNATIIDEKQTAELRSQAAEKVQKVYQEDTYALSSAENDIEIFYSNLQDILFADEERDNIKAKASLLTLLQSTSTRYSDLALKNTDLADYLLNADPEALKQMKEASLSVVQSLMDKPVTDETLADLNEEALGKIDMLSYSPEAREVIKLVSINSLRPNLIYNEEKTSLAVQEAMDAVAPVQKTIKAGEIIVREGNRVTEEQISILEQLGIQRTDNYTLTLIGTALFVLLTFWLVIEFVRKYYPEIYKNDMLLLLLGLIFVLIISITRFLTIIKIGDQPGLGNLIGYLAPVAAGSMLIAILLDDRLAYFITLIMALYVGLLTEGNQLFYAITAFVGGTVGIFQVYRVNQTSDLARSGLFIALADIAAIVTLLFIGDDLNLSNLAVGAAIGAVNGILSAVLMIGVLPYLEAAFSITSMSKLLELSNPNNPLLKRLLLQAPGTYHHSLMVGNLAEASAESIGANPLLVRVGALYHDIGKIKRPEYFVENQRGFDNPHEKIAPALSTLIITSHVKEGVEMAREAHLPVTIIDFIEQHHGTSLAKYFYSRALEEDRDGNVNEDNFRYEGPRPKSKETALVMLADSVEAAVRSLESPSPEKIRDMVRMLIKDKLNDGQLEMCDLTFKDLDIISKSFNKVLEGIYHKRIEYPEVIQKEFEQRSGNDGYDDH
ncbi:membrane protein [hydrocarbon metagenome]|uniref:Membrane protein n=1 Tax=hydrocarbon metagenome TaxID=938273 RepID=A0A0W8E786_9ZZZZ